MAATIQSFLNKVQLIDADFTLPFKGESKNKKRKIRTLGHHRGKPGCYLIKENGKVVYVGMSVSCVVEALYRHFYEWNDYREKKGYQRTTYFRELDKHDYQVVIILTEDAVQLERSLIVFLNPRDNKQKYHFAIEEMIEKHKPKNNVNDGPWSNKQLGDDEDLPF